MGITWAVSVVHCRPSTDAKRPVWEQNSTRKIWPASAAKAITCSCSSVLISYGFVVHSLVESISFTCLYFVWISNKGRRRMLYLINRFPMPKSVFYRLQCNGDIRFRSGSVYFINFNFFQPHCSSDRLLGSWERRFPTFRITYTVLYIKKNT